MDSITVSKKVNEVIRNFQHGDRVKRVGLFGSVARGEATAESDIDLLIDFLRDDFVESNPLFAFEKMYMFNTSLRDAFNPVELTIMDVESIDDEYNYWLKEAIEEDLVWIYDAKH